MKIYVEIEDYVKAKLVEFLTDTNTEDIIQPMTDWIVKLVNDNCHWNKETLEKNYSNSYLDYEATRIN